MPTKSSTRIPHPRLTSTNTNLRPRLEMFVPLFHGAREGWPFPRCDSRSMCPQLVLPFFCVEQAYDSFTPDSFSTSFDSHYPSIRSACEQAFSELYEIYSSRCQQYSRRNQISSKPITFEGSKLSFSSIAGRFEFTNIYTPCIYLISLKHAYITFKL